MLREELLKLAKSICENKTELQNVELKSANKGCPTRLYDTLSSFSNQDSGGILIFGIDEDNGFEPVDVYNLQDLQKKVTEQCNQMEPPVRAIFTVAEIDGKTICSAEIPSIDISERPCYYKGAGRVKGSYIRVGEADLPMTDSELYTFEAFRKHLHDDERKIEKAKYNMLDDKLVEDYINSCKENRPGFSKLSNEQILEMLHITSDGVPTMASMLNFGIYPQGYFPQLAITCIVVPGTEIGETASDNARFIDNKRVEGTISEMVRDAVSFCQRNMKSRTIIDPNSGARTDKTEYPVNAIREAILNALIHRDYSIYSETIPVQLIMFSDRMEIRSPGGLYGRMTIEQLGYAKMDLRNPTLAVMAEKITEAENRNSGIPTMRRECAAYGLPEPIFNNKRNEFVVTFFSKQVSELRETEIPDDVNLVEFCKEPRTRREIAAYLGIETVFYAMDKYVKPLLESGELHMTLPDKPKSSKQKYYSIK